MKSCVKLKLHRASDMRPVEINVDDIYYYQALSSGKQSMTKLVTRSGECVVREDIRVVQQGCLGC